MNQRRSSAYIPASPAPTNRSPVECATTDPANPQPICYDGLINNDPRGFVKIVSDPATGVVMGGSIVGRHAAELISILALAVNNSSSTTQVTLNFTTDIGNINIRVPVSLPITTATTLPATALPSVAVIPAQPEIRVLTPVLETEKINFWLWYGLPGALVILFLISMITLILTYKKQPNKSTATNNFQQQNKPFAYLVSQEENSKRYPIMSTTWRIGRSRDNELSLDDNSVSRLHAEIHRYNNGNFFILDMQSLNGIFVNEEQVSNRKLQEIGRASCRERV